MGRFSMFVPHFISKAGGEALDDSEYTCVKALLQGVGLMAMDRTRHTLRRQERKPLSGMMEFMDGSKYQWIGENDQKDRQRVD